MSESRMNLGKTSELKNMGDKSGNHYDSLCVDQLNMEGCGIEQQGVQFRPGKTGISKSVSYRDVFVNSDLTWKTCFQEW
ncbi:hypothetical protein MKX03_008514, partial [Papaver bracteatum]